MLAGMNPKIVRGWVVVHRAGIPVLWSMRWSREACIRAYVAARWDGSDIWLQLEWERLERLGYSCVEVRITDIAQDPAIAA